MDEDNKQALSFIAQVCNDFYQTLPPSVRPTFQASANAHLATLENALSKNATEKQKTK